MIAIPHARAKRPQAGTLRRRFHDYYRRKLRNGITPTPALIREAFPGIDPKTLSNYLARIRRDTGTVVRSRSYGLTGEDETERALIEAAIEEVRAEKIARGEWRAPGYVPLERLLIGVGIDARGDDA